MSYHGLGQLPGGLTLPNGAPAPVPTSTSGEKSATMLGPLLTSGVVTQRITSVTADYWAIALAEYKQARATGAAVPIAAEAGRQAAIRTGATAQQASDIATRLLRFSQLTRAISAALTAYMAARGRGATHRVGDLEARNAARRAGAQVSELPLVMAEVRVLYQALRERVQREAADMDRARRQRAAEAAAAATAAAAAEAAAAVAAEAVAAAATAAEAEAATAAAAAAEAAAAVAVETQRVAAMHAAAAAERASAAAAAVPPRAGIPWLKVGVVAGGVGLVGLLLLRRRRKA